MSDTERSGRAWVIVAISAMGASGLLFAAAWLGLPMGAQGPTPDAAVTGSVVAVQMLFAVLLVTTASSVVDDSVPVRVCRPLPVASGSIAAGIVLPMVALAAGVALVLLPAVVTGAARLEHMGVATGIIVFLACVEFGTAWGLTASLISRLVVRVLGWSASMQYPVGLMVAAGVGVCQAVSLLNGGVAWLGWVGLAPMVHSLMPDGPPVLLLALVGVTALLACVAWTYSVTVLRVHVSAISGRPLVGWSPGGALPLLRLEVVRLLRHPKIAGSVVAICAVELIGAVAVAHAGVQLRQALFGVVVVATGTAIAQPALLIRGYSPRVLPLQLQLFGGPARWAATLVGASGTVVVVPYVLAMAVTWYLFRDVSVMVFATGACVLGIGAGYLVGTALPASRENAAGSMVGMTLIALAVYGGLSAGVHVAASGYVIGAVASALGAIAVVVACGVERWRWVGAIEAYG